LALRGFADERLSVFGEGHDGWRRAETFCVCDDRGFSTFENSNHGVRGSEVNSY
jgi:hypothetical protein